MCVLNQTVTLSKYYIILLVFFSLNLESDAQDDINTESFPAVLVSVDYSGHASLADLNDRFGLHSIIGLGIDYKSKSNWLIGGQGLYMFGNNVFEDSLLNNMYNSFGFITANDGGPADIAFSQSGWLFGAKVGKLISLGSNKNSGIKIEIGSGFIQHKIRIDNKDGNIAQLRDEYIKGYDRLSSGLYLSQFIGYMYLSENRRINFYIGLDIIEGFTTGRRSWLYDVNRPDLSSRTDVSSGLKLGWVLPIYKGETGDRYYTN